MSATDQIPEIEAGTTRPLDPFSKALLARLDRIISFSSDKLQTSLRWRSEYVEHLGRHNLANEIRELVLAGEMEPVKVPELRAVLGQISPEGTRTWDIYIMNGDDAQTGRLAGSIWNVFSSTRIKEHFRAGAMAGGPLSETTTKVYYHSSFMKEGDTFEEVFKQIKIHFLESFMLTGAELILRDEDRALVDELEAAAQARRQA